MIVDRRTATVRPDNPAAYRRTVTRQVRTEHETEISKLLEDGRTVLQVADRVEPPDPAELERRVQIRRQQLADLHAQGRFECDRCQDHGTVEVHDDAGKYIGQARCPQCNTKGND